MRKTYSIPKVDCILFNTRDIMQTETASVGGGGNQNLFSAPRHDGGLF